MRDLYDFDDLDLPASDAIAVWHDLTTALAGNNGYGGAVAEIYAYRLVPPQLRRTDPTYSKGSPEAEEAAKTKIARVAGANMTLLLRRFVDLHEGAVISIQEGRDEFRDLDLSQDFPPFDWRVHLLVSPKHGSRAPSVQALRAVITDVAKHHDELLAMVDELAGFRAKARLYADVADLTKSPPTYDDLPPDAPTGLYLDRPFNADDVAWIKMLFELSAARNDGGPKRADQLMLVFSAIQRDARAMTAFLRAMNTIVLPLLRRLRLKEQPQLTKLGASGE